MAKRALEDAAASFRATLEGLGPKYPLRLMHSLVDGSLLVWNGTDLLFFSSDVNFETDNMVQQFGILHPSSKIDFVVKSIASDTEGSSSGPSIRRHNSVVLLVGDRSCCVLQLPVRGSAGFVGTTPMRKPDFAESAWEINCRVVQIGTRVQRTKPWLKVVQAGIHPLSPDHVLVLDSEGTLRLYNTLQDADVPEQSVEVLEASAARGGGPTALAGTGAEPVGFSFGPAVRKGWSQFAVFVLLSNGDVYTVCPLLPYGCRVPDSMLRELLASVRAAMYAYDDASETARVQHYGVAGASSTANEADIEARFAVLSRQQQWLVEIGAEGRKKANVASSSALNSSNLDTVLAAEDSIPLSPLRGSSHSLSALGGRGSPAMSRVQGRASPRTVRGRDGSGTLLTGFEEAADLDLGWSGWCDTRAPPTFSARALRPRLCFTHARNTLARSFGMDGGVLSASAGSGGAAQALSYNCITCLPAVPAVLLLGSPQGFVDIVVLSSDIEGSWSGDEVAELDAGVLFERIELHQPAGLMHFEHDVLYVDRVYARNFGGVYAITLPWLDAYVALFDDDAQGTDLSQAVATLPQSSCIPLVSTTARGGGMPVAMYGAVVTVHNHALIVWTADGAVSLADLAVVDTQLGATALQLSLEELQLDSKAQASQLDAYLDPAVADSQRFLQRTNDLMQSMLRSKATVLAGAHQYQSLLDNVSEEGLAALSATVYNIRQHQVQVLTKLYTEIEARATYLEDVEQQQQDHIDTLLQDFVEPQLAVAAALNKKAQEALDAQYKIDERIAILLSALSMLQPGLSRAEQGFVSDVDRLKRIVDERRSQVDGLEYSVNQEFSSRSRVADESPGKAGLSSRHMQQLESALKQQHAVLSKLSEAVESLKRDLGTLRR